jgi:hypothetical protein
MTDISQEEVVAPEANEGEGNETPETVSIPKSDYDKLNQTLGSLKRELKDLRKPKEDTSTPQTKPDDALLQKLERLSLRTAGITHQDDVDLAKATAKKWGMDIDEVLVDEDFKVKLERLQTSRANTTATAGVRGGQGTSQAKNTPEYWMAKGATPTKADVSDRKTRATIIRAMMKNSATSGKTFYND